MSARDHIFKNVYMEKLLKLLLESNYYHKSSHNKFWIDTNHIKDEHGINYHKKINIKFPSVLIFRNIIHYNPHTRK